MERGTSTGRTKVLYVPPHNIGITFGSKSDHALGQQVYCLHGETEILTTDGIYKIQDLENKQFKVYTYNIDNNIIEISNTTTAINTTTTNDYYEIELENGSIVKCTGNHLWLLKNGTYKRTDELTVEDELEDV
jgi:hypothetical protein